MAPLPCQLPACLAATLPATLPATLATSAQSNTRVPPMTGVSGVEGLRVDKEKRFPLMTTWHLARLSRQPGSSVLHYQTPRRWFLSCHIPISKKKKESRVGRGGKFLGGPVAEIPSSQFKGPRSIPGQGTRSYMPQLNIPHAATETRGSQINKYLK